MKTNDIITISASRPCVHFRPSTRAALFCLTMAAKNPPKTSARSQWMERREIGGSACSHACPVCWLCPAEVGSWLYALSRRLHLILLLGASIDDGSYAIA